MGLGFDTSLTIIAMAEGRMFTNELQGEFTD
jgi:hypothetical protein